MDLTVDQTIYTINETQFDFAVYVNTLSGNETRRQTYYRYMKYYVSALYQSWEIDETGVALSVWGEDELKSIPCPSGRFLNDTNFTDSIGLEENYLCLENMTF